MTAAKIRVELDTAQAQSQLSALYRQASSPVSVPVAGAGVPGGGGGGAGGMGLGRLAAIGGGLAGIFGGIGRGTIGTASGVANAGVASASHRLEQSIFGDTNARMVGSRNALEQVKADVGLAIGFGAAPESFDALFAVKKSMEVKRAIGEKAMETRHGPGISGRAANDLVDKLEKKLDEILKKIP